MGGGHSFFVLMRAQVVSGFVLGTKIWQKCHRGSINGDTYHVNAISSKNGVCINTLGSEGFESHHVLELDVAICGKDVDCFIDSGLIHNFIDI